MGKSIFNEGKNGLATKKKDVILVMKEVDKRFPNFE